MHSKFTFYLELYYHNSATQDGTTNHQKIYGKQQLYAQSNI